MGLLPAHHITCSAVRVPGPCSQEPPVPSAFVPSRVCPPCLCPEPPRAFLPTVAPVRGPSLAWDTASLGPLLPPCLQMKHEVTLQQVAVGLADHPLSALGCWDVGGHFPES